MQDEIFSPGNAQLKYLYKNSYDESRQQNHLVNCYRNLIQGVLLFTAVLLSLEKVEKKNKKVFFIKFGSAA